MKVFIIRNLENPPSAKYASECAASCDDVGVKYEFYEGSWGRTYEELKSKLNLDYPVFDDPFSSLGKYANNMYNQYTYLYMAIELNEPIAILEHDIIVKNDFTNFKVEVTDNSIYYLTCCVNNREDYIYPKGSNISLSKVIFYDGNKAKILTPEFSRQFLEFKNKNPKDDSWRQFYKSINQYVLDPIPTVCETGSGRMSTITNTTGVLNEFLPSSFFNNLRTPELKQYYINSIKECYKVPINYEIYMEMKS